jgi:hypothetical protein
VNLWIPFVVPTALLLMLLGLQWLETSLLGKSIRQRVRAGVDRVRVPHHGSRPPRIGQRRNAPARRGHGGAAGGGRVRWLVRRRALRRGGSAARPRQHRRHARQDVPGEGVGERRPHRNGPAGAAPRSSSVGQPSTARRRRSDAAVTSPTTAPQTPCKAEKEVSSSPTGWCITRFRVRETGSRTHRTLARTPTLTRWRMSRPTSAPSAPRRPSRPFLHIMPCRGPRRITDSTHD